MRALLAVAVLMIVSACQAPPAEMTPEQVAQIEEAVLAQANALIETQNAFDAEGFLAQFSTDELDWYNQDVHHTSFQDLAGVLENFFTGLDAFDSGWKNVSVEVLSETTALCRGEWWGVQTRGEVASRYESVFWTSLHEVQTDGSWKITTVHQSWADPVTEG